jgi:choline dehydrogenase-like flavoprotein
MTGQIVVVGTGPVGCSVARLAHERAPRSYITMIEAGSHLSAGPPGRHVKNSPTYRARHSGRAIFDLGSVEPTSGAHAGAVFRPGTTAFGAAGSRGMPAAAVATNVGGMGIYWTCAAPRPSAAERSTHLTTLEWEAALRTAERILSVGQFRFPDHELSADILRRLRTEYGELKGPSAPTTVPLAASTRRGEPHWVGSDAILSGLIRSDRFKLIDRAVCRGIVTSGGTVEGVVLRRASADRDTYVGADTVVVATGPFRTPQLLWASGVRLPALGRYLNEHRQILAAVAYPARPVYRARDADRTAGMYMVPFAAKHAWQGQVMHFDQQPIVDGRVLGPQWSVIGLSWFVPTSVRAENGVRFSESHHDELDMPAGVVEFDPGVGDGERVRAGISDLERAATALGGQWVDGGHPAVQPGGYSLHVQGTVRLGGSDDTLTSVCDPDGRVRGYANLFVAGTGVIPNETAVNPTLTAVALGTRTAAAVAELVGARRGTGLG